MSVPTPIWAPWRMEYIKRGPDSKSCFLCEYLKKDKKNEKNEKDEKIREPILDASKYSYVIMNRFPYNPGHLLIVPKRHIGKLEELKIDEYHDLCDLVRKTIQVVNKALKPEGTNLGLNLGKAAGAGIFDHLHYHVVPRWVGDTNFMPIISETKVISEHLSSTYKTLREEFINWSA